MIGWGISRLAQVYVERHFVAVALGAGLIIAFVTTFYLKRKEEVTRVAGLILAEFDWDVRRAIKCYQAGVAVGE